MCLWHGSWPGAEAVRGSQRGECLPAAGGQPNHVAVSGDVIWCRALPISESWGKGHSQVKGHDI